MTVSKNNIESADYVGDGLIAQLPFNFYHDRDDNDVAIKLFERQTDGSYIQSTLGFFVNDDTSDDEAGMVILDAPLAIGTTVKVVRDTPLHQEQDIDEVSRFDPKNQEKAYDKLTTMIQEVFNRCFKLDVGNGSAPLFPRILPNAFLKTSAAGVPYWGDATDLGYGDSDVTAFNLTNGVRASVGFASKSDLKAFSGYSIAPRVYHDGSDWNWITGAKPEDGGIYSGTVIHKTSDTSGYWERDYDGYVDAKWFGVSVEAQDNTTALENAFGFIVTNGGNLQLPKGVIRHTGVRLPAGQGFGVFGYGQNRTFLTCTSDSYSCLQLGESDQEGMHSFEISDLTIDYATFQVGNTQSYNLQFTANVYHLTMNRVLFNNGYTGMKVDPDTDAPWGCTWDDIDFGRNMQGNCMDWSGASSATPNNVWGRIGVDAANLSEGTIFKDLQGYNWSIQCIELFGENTNQCIMSLQAGSVLNLTSIKQELIVLDGSVNNNALFYFPANCYVHIGTLTISGTYARLNPSSDVYIVRAGGGGDEQKVKIDYVDVNPTQAVSNVYLCNASRNVEIDYLNLNRTFSIPFTNLGASVGSEHLKINNVLNDSLSSNKGDSDYTVSLGDPMTIMYETALTADRTVTIPGENGKLFNGMKYKIVCQGKGTAFAINIFSDGGVRASIPATDDNVFVEVMYRRHATGGGGWKVIGRGSI